MSSRLIMFAEIDDELKTIALFANEDDVDLSNPFFGVRGKYHEYLDKLAKGFLLECQTHRMNLLLYESGLPKFNKVTNQTTYEFDFKMIKPKGWIAPLP